jgi:hypothetical protein
MTKQQILDKYVPCSCWPVKDGGKKVYNSSCPQHSPDPESAMDDWAEQESIIFTEWVAEQTWENYCDGVRFWRMKYSNEPVTANRLYQLYKKSHENSNS